MLLFYCTHCAKMIAADDSESTDQIVDWLDEHIAKCPSTAFTYEERQMLLGGELAVYDHVLKRALRIRYGHPDDPARDRATDGHGSARIPRHPRPGNPRRDF